LPHPVELDSDHHSGVECYRAAIDHQRKARWPICMSLHKFSLMPELQHFIRYGRHRNCVSDFLMVGIFRIEIKNAQFHGSLRLQRTFSLISHYRLHYLIILS